MERIDIDGHDLAFHREGAGEPVLLVHGITTYSFIWRKILPVLAKQYDVVAVDLCGCGESDKPLDVSYSLTAHAECMIKLAEKLNFKKLHYVGHDLGGGIGQIIAVQRPDILFDLALINSVAYDFWPVQPIVAMRTPVIRQFIMGSLDLGTLKLMVKRGVYHKDRVDAELMELFWRPLRSPSGRKAFLHFARSLNNSELLEITNALPKLPMPVMIVRGEADRYLTPQIAQRLHENIPGSRLESLPTAGHYIHEDEPEILTDLILEFISHQSHGE